MGKLMVLLFVVLSTHLCLAEDTRQAECTIAFLQLNNNIINLPNTDGTFKYTLKPIPSMAGYQIYTGSLNTEVSWNSKDKSKKLKIKTFMKYSENASLWLEVGNRLQMSVTLLDENDNVIGTYRDHNERIVRDYQLEEIKNGKLILRLSYPIAVGWNKVYANPQTAAIAQTQGIEEALVTAYRLNILEGDVPREMSVQCHANN